MELTLSLEKLTNEKLLNLHKVANKNHDVQLADFVESKYLHEQVEAIKKISEYVAQLRRVGQGHGRNQNKISFLINVTNLTFSPLLNMIINYLNCLLSSPSKRVVLWWGISGVWHFDQMLLHGEEVVA
ncbi:hypothetical protein CISIN_1g0217031mg, partial [Citrus sinensis]